MEAISAFKFAPPNLLILRWKSYLVGPSTQEQRQALNELEIPLQLDFLSRPLLDREGVILVKPEHQVSFTDALEKQGISYRIHSADVKE